MVLIQAMLSLKHQCYRRKQSTMPYFPVSDLTGSILEIRFGNMPFCFSGRLHMCCLLDTTRSATLFQCPLVHSERPSQSHNYTATGFFFPLTKIKSSAKLLLWLPLLLSTEWVTWTHTETILNSFLKQFGPIKEPYAGSQHCVVRYDIYNLEGRYTVTLE